MGQGERILFRVLTSSDLEYLRGGREAFAYGEGQGVEDKSCAQSRAVTQSTMVRSKVKVK